MWAWRSPPLSGVDGWKENCGLPDPAGEALSPARGAPPGLGGGAALVRRERRGRRADQPGVHREPLAAGGLLDPGLERVGQPEVDPGHRTVLDVREGDAAGATPHR